MFLHLPPCVSQVKLHLERGLSANSQVTGFILQRIHAKEFNTQNLSPNNLDTNNKLMIIQVTIINTLTDIKETSLYSSFLFLSLFILRKRECVYMCVRVSGAGAERERAPCCQCTAPRGAPSHEPQDQDLSQNQELEA